MKKTRDIDELAKQLTAAATTPLQKIVDEESSDPVKATEAAKPAQKRKQKSDAIPVFLRLPAEMYKHFDEIAIARTKETGRGTSIQQILIEELERNR